MKQIYIFLLTLSLLYSDTIRFSPLPMDKSPKIFLQYKDMLSYLSEQTGDIYEFVYSSSYEDLINNFKQGKIDIIELGPLPFVKLSNTFPSAKAIVTFNSQDGKPFYTCDLVSIDPKIEVFSDIAEHTKDILLTRKLSTCGFLMTEFIFNENKSSLEDFRYSYVGTHSKVLLELLLQSDSIGTVKSTVLNKYSHFKFTTIAQSPPIPGFALIVDTQRISEVKIAQIQNAMTKIKPLENEKDHNFVLNWSTNTKYGAIKTAPNTYKFVEDATNTIPIYNNENQ